MPPTEEVHGDARVTPWLWGLLPDDADVLTRWGRDFGVSTASPFPLLGTQVGHDCAGAVQFCEPDEADDLLGTPGNVTWLTEAEVAARLRTLRADSTSWLGPGFARRTDRRSAWEHAADELKLDRSRLIARVLDLAERTPATFDQAVGDTGVGELSTSLPDRLATLVSQRCDRQGSAELTWGASRR